MQEPRPIKKEWLVMPVAPKMIRYFNAVWMTLMSTSLCQTDKVFQCGVDDLDEYFALPNRGMMIFDQRFQERQQAYFMEIQKLKLCFVEMQ